ncbi:accessory gene regulator B family protein [Anaerorhabdus sp.]|jgi:accessory gene regulator B|uniref:accessory gene regulator B family protein n=1 Tax=Anaerorhabdus sp. TaxID=1872524 RepID=UPI002FC9E6EB
MDEIYHNLSKKIFEYLNKLDNIEEDKNLYLHAIELTIHESVTNLIVLILASFFGFPFESIIYMILFAFIRKYTGGYHAETYAKCMLLYILFFLIFILIYVAIDNIYIGILLVFIVSVLYIVKETPIQHVNNQLSIIERHKYRKISLVILGFYTSLGLILLILHSKISVIIYVVIIFDSLLMFFLKHSVNYVED